MRRCGANKVLGAARAATILMRECMCQSRVYSAASEVVCMSHVRRYFSVETVALLDRMRNGEQISLAPRLFAIHFSFWGDT